MAISVATMAGGERITWTVEITWEQRREMIRGEGIMAVGDRNYVNPPLLAPAVIECVTGWDREEPVSEQAIYALPLGHLLDLVRQVGLWVLEGREPGTGNRQPDGNGDDGGEGAVPFANGSPG